MSQAAVSSVLIKEDRGEQKPIFYTSRRMTGPETRYPTLEKMALAVVESTRKLRPYFQSHLVEVLTDQPLRTILQNTNSSGRLTNWAIDLGELDITIVQKPNGSKVPGSCGFFSRTSPRNGARPRSPKPKLDTSCRQIFDQQRRRGRSPIAVSDRRTYQTVFQLRFSGFE